jgi:16S rRNA G966 N2-methylase RsmD
LDDEALFSTTDQLTADKIACDILKFLPKTSTITDATACIGGSAYSFSQVFEKVYAIELDSTRFKHMVHNFEQLNCKNVHCINGDALNEVKSIHQDVIFIDPPWGGPEYKAKAKLTLYLSGVNIAEACIAYSKTIPYVVLKVPTNFDESTFMESIKAHLKLVHKNQNLRKMHLLILQSVKNPMS